MDRSDVREPWQEPCVERLAIAETAFGGGIGGDGSNTGFPDDTRS